MEQTKLGTFFQIGYGEKKYYEYFIYDESCGKAWFSKSVDNKKDTFLVKKCGFQFFLRKGEKKNLGVSGEKCDMGGDSGIGFVDIGLMTTFGEKDIPLLKSNLQKAVRRCEWEIARDTMLCLIFMRQESVLLRRLAIIMVEDTKVFGCGCGWVCECGDDNGVNCGADYIIGIETIVWLMVTVSSGVYDIGIFEIKWLLRSLWIMVHMREGEGDGFLEYNKVDIVNPVVVDLWNDKKGQKYIWKNNKFNELFKVGIGVGVGGCNNAELCGSMRGLGGLGMGVCLSLYIRKLYGGMAGDMNMLGGAFQCCIDNIKSFDVGLGLGLNLNGNNFRNSDLVVLGEEWREKINVDCDVFLNEVIKEERNIDCDIIWEAIDFHCFPEIIWKLSKETGLDKSEIKELIWFVESGVNVRKKWTLAKSEELGKSAEWILIEEVLEKIRGELILLEKV